MPARTRVTKKGGKKGKPAAAPKASKPLTETEQLLMQRLEDVATRSHHFSTEIEQLKASAKKREHEVLDHASHLSNELEKKTKEESKLLENLKNLTNESISDKLALKRQFEATLTRVENIFLQKEQQLLDKNKALMKEVSDLSLYKKMRHDLAKELELTKQTIQKNEERHKRQLDELERKFIAAKEALQKEAAERIAHSRKVYKEEVGKELDYESKLVRKKNREMSKELKFHEKRSNELMTENQRLQALVKKLKIDMSLTEEKEKAYALRGVKQKRLIREATEKQKALEMSLTQALREFDLEREATEMENSRVVQELQQGVDKNRHIAVLRDKELRVIRKNAKVLLKNRQEMEQFFLEAMDTVKQQIREERRAEHALAVQTHQHHIRSLAQNSASGQRYAARTPAPRAPSKDVELKDLTLEDREKVLRLLFSKINNVQARNSSHLPPHSFDISVHQEGPLLLEGEHDGEEDGQQPDETFLTNMDTPL